MTLRDYSYPSLFTWGQFTAASGRTLDWKIDCDFLTLDDWRTLARVVAPRIPSMREVVGVPKGGETFARCLVEAGVLAPKGEREGRPRLIVDDVWTTGSTVAKIYQHGDFVVVAFARGSVPYYVTPVWQLEEGFSEPEASGPRLSEDLASEIAHGGGSSGWIQVPGRCDPTLPCLACGYLRDTPNHVYGCPTQKENRDVD